MSEPVARSDSLQRRVMARFSTLTLFTAIGIAPFQVAAQSDKYDVARANHPELFQVYYDEGVMEYCGLQTRESMGGFVLQRDDLLAAAALSEDETRDVRIAGNIAADMEFDNRGLGGYRIWCKTEGRDAYNRFVTVFRAHADIEDETEQP